ncbi:MAG: hypothetical protein E2P02_01990 [Acidobacteria bacterium]|nr:MAG: hypothetical protein E2P02_01990 [Acidobacteriota bacterium]
MLAPVASQTGGATQIHVVLNWTEELKRQMLKDLANEEGIPLRLVENHAYERARRLALTQR